MLVTFPFDHIVLRLSEKSVLRPEERGDFKKIAIQPLKNARRVFELRRHRGRVQQRPDKCTAQFLRPKLAQMIEWKFDVHPSVYTTITAL